MSALPSDESFDGGLDSLVLRQFEADEPGRLPLDPKDLTWQQLRDIWWLVRCIHPDPHQDRAENPAAVVNEPDQPKQEPSPDPVHPPDESTPPRRADPVPPRGQEEWVPHHRGVIRSTFLDHDTSRVSAPLRWPAVPALPDPRGIERALRPLMKPVPSPWRKMLDEEATAVRAVQDGMWLPEWQPASSRRFELVVIVDSAPTMEIWRQTADEFSEILRHQGAFRDFRTYLMDCSHTENLLLKVDGADQAPRKWTDLVDPTGRRMVLLLTDAIGAGWRNGSAERVVAGLASRMPFAIVNVLADRLWSWGGLSPRRVCLSSPQPGVPNSQFRLWPGKQTYPPDAIAVPVLGLTPEWLSGWANLVAGVGTVETTAVFVSTVSGDDYVDDMPDPDDDDLSPHDRVLRFRTYASVRAFQLACLIAAAPLNLPIIQLVEQVMLDGSDLSTVAEVLLGGIIRRVPILRSVTDPTSVAYEFLDGVREELLSMGTRADTVRVARILGNHAGSRVPILRNFRDAVDLPATAAYPEVSAESLPYLRVQEAVFRALSGAAYATRANRLRAHTIGQRTRASAAPPAQPANNASDGSIADTRGGSTKSMTVTAEDRDEMSVSNSPSTTEPRRDTVGRPQIWGSVPLRNPDFVGREDLLERLRLRLFEPGATAVLPEALHGMGGVGKSQTVVEYIYRHSAEYDVIWWIPSEQLSQINASFIELAKKLGLPATSAETARPEVLEALRTGTPHRRWLLVFDNADAPEIVSPFIPASSGHVVVTSRNSQWAGVARTVEVDLFTRKESTELLRRRGGEITDVDADRLATALGDLPLAVEQAAAWRAQTGMPVAEYLELLEQHLTELLGGESAVDYGAMGYQRSVAAAWNVPLHRLRTSHPAALQLLQVCAFFGPEPISRSLFTGGRAVPVPEDLANALKDPIKLNRAIREISRYSLAKIDHRNNTLQLHRLVQTVLKNQLSEDEKDQMRHAVHVLLVHGDPDDPESSLTWPRYAELLPHATVSHALECQSDAWVRRLIINLVRYLLNSGDYGSARTLGHQTMAAWQAHFGNTDADTLAMARLCGVALWRLGRHEEAGKLNKETYDLVQSTFGEDNELFLSVADTLRSGMRAQGQFAEELAMQQDIFEKSSHVLGEDDPATLRYANNLAGSLRLNGQFFKARTLDEDTWRRKKIVLGEEHSDTFLTRNALAMDLRECGQYVEACQIQEENLARQRVVIGDDHPRTIGAMRNLAVARRKAGLHKEAKDLSEECAKLYRIRQGDRHLDTITAEMSLSADLRVLGDLPGSKNLAEHSHQLFVETYGEKHPFTLVSAINLAVTLRLLGSVNEARRINEETLAALREVFGKDHPFSLVCATNLASDLAAQSELTAAHELDVDTLERSTRVLGGDHPSTLAVALNRTIDLVRLRRQKEAAPLHTKVVAEFRRSLGPEHPATLAAAQSIRANCDTDTMQL